MKDSEIAACVDECLNGKKETFGRIARFFQKGIYGFCLQFTGTSQDAEDAATEIFLKAYRSLPSYNREYRFSTWIYKIAFHHLVEISRKKKREKRYLDSQCLEGPDHTETRTPASVFFDTLEKEKLKESLGSLPLKYRTALMLRYFQGLSYGQIGEIMEIPPNTVGSLLLRGKRELRLKMLETEGLR